MRTFLFITVWAFALWLIGLNVRIVLSFVQTDRPWRFHRPDPDRFVRPGALHRLRVVVHYLGCALSAANPLVEPFRPAIAAIKRALWFCTEPVLRLVRKLPVKFSITTLRRDDVDPARRSIKARLSRAEEPPRRGMLLDFGPGLVLLVSYGVVMRFLIAEHSSANPSAAAALALWALFLACVAAFVPHYRETIRPAAVD